MAFGYGYPYQPVYQPPTSAAYQPMAAIPQQYQQVPQQPVQPQMQPQAQGQPNMICRPVASEEEARATATPFDGSTLILTDFGHGKVYSKALNYSDGSALFNTYQLIQQATPTEPQAPAVEYAPRSELESLRAELDNLRAELEETKKTSVKKPTAKGAAE